MRTRFLSFLILGLPLVACRTTYESSPADADELEVRVGRLVASWRIEDGDRLAGWLRRYASPGAVESYFFVVQNEYGQDMGIVDAHGRAWRSLPHQDEKEWLTTDTVLEGARRILGLGPGIRLEGGPDLPDEGSTTAPEGEAGVPMATDSGV